jgi:hypothetical protein
LKLQVLITSQSQRLLDIEVGLSQRLPLIVPVITVSIIALIPASIPLIAIYVPIIPYMGSQILINV